MQLQPHKHSENTVLVTVFGYKKWVDFMSQLRKLIPVVTPIVSAI